MNEPLKYPKIYRICTKEAPSTKKCLSESEISALLDGEVIVEEKIDGGICGISWKGDTHHAQGRGRIVHYAENSKQFHGFNKWIYENYEKIQQIPGRAGITMDARRSGFSGLSMIPAAFILLLENKGEERAIYA